MHEQSLALDADLSRVSECRRERAAERPREIGVVVHDDGGVAAELEQDALLAGDRLEVPTDLGASGERECREAIVAHERFGDGDVAWEHLECARRSARLR